MTDEPSDFLPIIFTYDELTDMWSYYIGGHAGVADSKQELVDKVYELIYNGENELDD